MLCLGLHIPEAPLRLRQSELSQESNPRESVDEGLKGGRVLRNLLELHNPDTPRSFWSIRPREQTA